MNDDKSIWENNIIEAPLKVALLAVPFLASLFLGWCLIGLDDTRPRSIDVIYYEHLFILYYILPLLKSIF